MHISPRYSSRAALGVLALTAVLSGCGVTSGWKEPPRCSSDNIVSVNHSQTVGPNQFIYASRRAPRDGQPHYGTPQSQDVGQFSPANRCKPGR